MNENKAWEFKKGNTNELPTVSKSGKPIDKENIDESILEFIYKKLLDDSKLLKVSEFDIEFLCFGELTAFIKINIKSGNKKIIDLNLKNQDAKEFVELIKNTRFYDGDMKIPPKNN